MLMWQMANAACLLFLFDVVHDAYWPYMYQNNSVFLLNLYEIQVMMACILLVHQNKICSNFNVRVYCLRWMYRTSNGRVDVNNSALQSLVFSFISLPHCKWAAHFQVSQTPQDRIRTRCILVIRNMVIQEAEKMNLEDDESLRYWYLSSLITYCTCTYYMYLNCFVNWNSKQCKILWIFLV